MSCYHPVAVLSSARKNKEIYVKRRVFCEDLSAGDPKGPRAKKKARPLSRTLEGMRKLGRATKIGGGKGLVPATRPSEKESYLDKGSVQRRVEHPGGPVFLQIGITIPALDEAEASGLDGNQVTQCGLGIVPDRVVQEGD